jgi:glycerophosphoryl diester phosphodiesterase
MMAVMRRLADAVAGAQDLSAVARPLNLAVQQWRTLGRLYSRDITEIRNGMLDVRAHPFPEAKLVLEDLELRYRNNMELYPEILDAITSVEEANRTSRWA